jgi:hypothetical protein
VCNIDVPLTTGIWAVTSPLHKHQDHHVQEQEAHEDNLRHKLTINVDALLEVSEKRER